MKPSGNTQFIPDFDIKFHQIIEGVEMAGVVGNHSTVAVGIRPPGRVWIELKQDRCRKIIYQSVCYGVHRTWHRQVTAH